jgi:hypothetical protein
MPAIIILTVTEGNLKGQEFSFDSRTTCVIGRAKDCNIQIPSDKYHSTERLLFFWWCIFLHDGILRSRFGYRFDK